MRGLGWIAGALALLAVAGAAEPPAAAERRASMHRAGEIMRALRDDILAGRAVAPLGAEARQVADWAGRLVALFPPGGAPGEGNALATVWSDRAGFEARARDLDRQARRLVAAPRPATGPASPTPTAPPRRPAGVPSLVPPALRL